MSLTSILVDSTDLTAAYVASLVRTRVRDPRRTIRSLCTFLLSHASGVRRGSIRLRTGTVASTATLVASSTGPANGQTVQVCGTLFTAATTPSGANDFQRSDTPATAMANLAALLNTVDAVNRPKVNAAVTASVVGATLTLTARDPGLQSNGLHVAAVGTFANVAITNFAGGSDGEQTDLDV